MSFPEATSEMRDQVAARYSWLNKELVYNQELFDHLQSEVHEAAHAVAHRHFGWKVTRCAIWPSDTTAHRHKGMTNGVTAASSTPAQWALVLAAGGVAQWLWADSVAQHLRLPLGGEPPRSLLTSPTLSPGDPGSDAETLAQVLRDGGLSEEVVLADTAAWVRTSWNSILHYARTKVRSTCECARFMPEAATQAPVATPPSKTVASTSTPTHAVATRGEQGTPMNIDELKQALRAVKGELQTAGSAALEAGIAFHNARTRLAEITEGTNDSAINDALGQLAQAEKQIEDLWGKSAEIGLTTIRYAGRL